MEQEKEGGRGGWGGDRPHPGQRPVHMMRTNYRIAHMIEHFLVFRTHVLLNEGEHTQRENGRLGEISSRFAHRRIVGRRFFCTLLRCRQKISSEFVEKNSLDVPPGGGGWGGRTHYLLLALVI